MALCIRGILFFILAPVLCFGVTADIGFLAYQNDSWALYRWDGLSVPELILEEPYLRDWDISPDLSTIAYSTTDGKMYLYDLTGKQSHPLNSSGDDWQNPSFQNNQQLFAVKNSLGASIDDSDLIQIDIPKRQVQQIYEQDGPEEYPDICPKNPQLMAYAVIRKDAFGTFTSSIWRMDLERGITEQVTRFTGNHFRPVMNPQCNRLAWIEQDHTGYRVKVKDSKEQNCEIEIYLSEAPLDSITFLSDSVLALTVSDGLNSTIIVLNLEDNTQQTHNPFPQGALLRELHTWN